MNPDTHSQKRSGQNNYLIYKYSNLCIHYVKYTHHTVHRLHILSQTRSKCEALPPVPRRLSFCHHFEDPPIICILKCTKQGSISVHSQHLLLIQTFTQTPI